MKGVNYIKSLALSFTTMYIKQSDQHPDSTNLKSKLTFSLKVPGYKVTHFITR